MDSQTRKRRNSTSFEPLHEPETRGQSTAPSRFSEHQMQAFQQKQIQQRQQELQGISKGFQTPHGFSPGPVMKAKFALVQSRFDLSGVGEEHRDHVDSAMSGATHSMSMNQVVIGLGTTLLGNMMQNALRLKQDNFVRDLANMSGSPYSRKFVHGMNPEKAVGAEVTRLKVVTQTGTSPHFDPETSTVSLMNPSHMDQTSHELQHAYDHLHGDLDLNNPKHRIASELNAFTRQDSVSRQTTGLAPPMFEGRSPRAMAQSYEGKTKKGYEGTLEESIKSVQSWQKRPK